MGRRAAVTALQLHPLCTLFPRLDGAEFDALKADIAANGQRQAIIVHDGLILDGGNRYRACIEAGINPRIEQYGGADPLAFVLSANLHRRHLTPGQQAAIVAAATNWLEAHGHGGDRKSDQSATLHLETVADRATQSGASVRTQKMADKVAKSDPDLVKKVAHGEVTLPQAVKQVEKAQRPRRAQATLADAGEHESAVELAARTDAVARKPVHTSEPDGLIDELREQVSTLADELEEVRGELDAYRAAESGQGEAKLIEASKEIARLKGEIRRLQDRRDDLMNENAELKREVKRLRKQLGYRANG
ncbi:ParB N-terminal domain-containing protein [Burkholderia dolosa]|uniref:MT-A70 family protein n=1 Tax=Burkholderia multivorans CGD2 TaxID=513052 RepID=B9BQH6_9BURK|nr:MT-A70 family protein [Burkholderia multivorans CGD2]EEE13185.1 MT-A70 family protein [Burkholderia multivorans CGD2M]MBY4752028.1 ParB N-terminal domain-containing protein [Burkholderia dolosa]